MPSELIYLVRTPGELVLLAQAVNQVVGLADPVRGVVHGGPDTLPAEYEGEQTPGWTDAQFRGSWVAADLSIAATPVLPGMDQLAGMQVQVGDQLITLPTMVEAVAAADLPVALTEAGGAFWWGGRTDENGMPIP